LFQGSDGNIYGTTVYGGLSAKGTVWQFNLGLPSPCSLTVLPASLPDGTFGSGYNQAMSATGGAGAHSFSVASGNLPPGLSLTGAGQLSGTPTNIGNFLFGIKATGAYGCIGTNNYNVTIHCPTITLSPSPLPSPVVVSSYNHTLLPNGGL